MAMPTSPNPANDTGNRRRTRWLIAFWAILACFNLFLWLDGDGQASRGGLCLSLGMLCLESQNFVQGKPLRYGLGLMASIFIAGVGVLAVLHFVK